MSKNNCALTIRMAGAPPQKTKSSAGKWVVIAVFILSVIGVYAYSFLSAMRESSGGGAEMAMMMQQVATKSAQDAVTQTLQAVAAMQKGVQAGAGNSSWALVATSTLVVIVAVMAVIPCKHRRDRLFETPFWKHVAPTMVRTKL